MAKTFTKAAIKEVYSVQTFREAVPEFKCRESIIAQNSCCSLVSLAEIEYENRDAIIENRDALIENRDIVIPNRVLILDSCRDRESSVNLLLNGTVRTILKTQFKHPEQRH